MAQDREQSTSAPQEAEINGGKPADGQQSPLGSGVVASSSDGAGANGQETTVGPVASMGRGGGRRLSAYATRDLTSGSIPRNLLFLAWPQVIEGGLNSLDQLSDLFWAGRGVGANAIASIGVAQTYIQFLRLGRQGIDISMRAMIARSVGMGDMRLANHAVLQALNLNILLAFLTIVPGVIFTVFLLRILGVSDDLIAVGKTYMQIQFVASTAQGFRMSSGSALQAAGDTLTPMRATTIARIIDLGLTPLMIFGWLGFPALGLPGVAVVNVISGLIAFGINSYGLLKGSSKLKLTFHGYNLDFPLMGRMVKLGIPASITNAERSLAQLLIIGIVATFGDYALAAWALTRRVENISQLGRQGLGNATGVIAGQSIGAGRPERAKETVWWAMGYVMAINVITGSLLFAFPRFFLSIFNSEPELLEVGAVWMRILVVGFFFQGPTQVFMQTYQIAGDTMMPMITTLVTVWFVELPMALILSGVSETWTLFGWHPPLPVVTGLGQYGVAWAVSLAIGSRLLLFVPYFFWGPWTKKQIFGNRAGGRLRGTMRGDE
ncbi:MAG: MATE family efflux transporter [Chloroflexi bacterium]|nr:MATE family efflux transporter [Chloroflexota bacterium]